MIVVKHSLLLLIFSFINVIADNVPDHTEEPSISLDYDTVTQIIEALDPTEEELQDDLHQESLHQESEHEQVTPTDIIYEYVYEQHLDDMLKRRGGIYRKRKPQKQRVYYQAVIEPEVHEPEVPCETPDDEPAEEEEETPATEYITAEDSYGFVGSLKGKPGVDYPNYKEIPLTSFTCADKKNIPGFYADLETNCQVFHVCYPHRRESFLCPVGTTFNQPILACDYWYNSNCSLSPEYYEESKDLEPESIEEADLENIITVIEAFEPEAVTEEPCSQEMVTEEPIVAEIPEPVIPSKPVVVPEPIIPSKPVVIPEPSKPVVVPEPIIPRKPVVVVPEPIIPRKPVVVVPEPIIPRKPVVVPEPIIPSKPVVPEVASVAKFLPVKVQVKKFTVPLAVGKVVKTAAATKAKIAPAKILPVKLAKAKVSAASLKAIPIAKVVKAGPALKKAAIAKKAVLMKAKIAAPIVKPLLFKKAVMGKKVLLKKGKAVKVGKILAAKAAVPVVSALTKKHLALSLIKLLKAHKMASLRPHRYDPVYYY